MKIIIGSRTFTLGFTRQNLVRALAGAGLLLLGVWIGGGFGGPSGPAPQPAAPEPLDPMEGQLSPDGRALVENVSRGAMLFTFFHELGHMAINQLNLPATGPEEDTADEFSAFTMANQIASDDPGQQMLAATILSSGATFNRLFGKARAAQGPDAMSPWYDEHSPDERRFANILCIAVGASEQIYGQIALNAGMPPERIQRCKWEFGKKQAAWNALMAPHRKGAVERFFGMGGRLLLQVGGQPAPGHPTGPEVPRAPVLRAVYTQSGFFQTMLDQISDSIALPRDIPVIVRSCGMANAFWDPGSQTITLCDEMLMLIARVFTASVGRDEQQARQGPVTMPVAQGGGVPQPGQIAPQPGQGAPQPGGGGWPQPGQTAPQGQSPDIRTVLVGRWHCEGTYVTGGEVGYGRTSVDMVLRPDGTMQIDGQDTNGNRLQIRGRWSTRGEILFYHIEDYTPKEMCAPMGCQPLNLPRELKNNVVIDPFVPSSQITIGNDVCSRDPGR